MLNCFKWIFNTDIIFSVDDLRVFGLKVVDHRNSLSIKNLPREKSMITPTTCGKCDTSYAACACFDVTKIPELYNNCTCCLCLVEDAAEISFKQKIKELLTTEFNKKMDCLPDNEYKEEIKAIIDTEINNEIFFGKKLEVLLCLLCSPKNSIEKYQTQWRNIHTYTIHYYTPVWKNRTYYGMASVSVRPSVRPSVNIKVCV